MTITFTATNTLLNGNPVTKSRNEKAQFAIMLKTRLGLTNK